MVPTIRGTRKGLETCADAVNTDLLTVISLYLGIQHEEPRFGSDRGRESNLSSTN